VGGIEPPSENNAEPSSTCVVWSLFIRPLRCRPTGYRKNQPFSLSNP